MTDSTTSTSVTAPGAAEADPSPPVVGSSGDAAQQPSGMPIHKYQIGRASCRERV